MASIEHWNKYINLLHELALVEDDLRAVAFRELTTYDDPEEFGEHYFARQMLFERFGVDL